jgi:RNA polymerase sigma-70 factor (ECF subfamily)
MCQSKVNEATAKLVQDAIKGDSDSYGILIKSYTGFVYTMALRMTRDHHMAEDLCQETFIKGWIKLKKLKKYEAFPGWIATIARRTCLNAIEKRNRKKEVGEEESALENLNPTWPPSYNPARVVLEESISRLSLQDRQLLTLSYFQELSSAEVAEIMGISSSTVRVYLMRAREKLKAILKGRENELLT